MTCPRNKITAPRIRLLPWINQMGTTLYRLLDCTSHTAKKTGVNEISTRVESVNIEIDFASILQWLREMKSCQVRRGRLNNIIIIPESYTTTCVHPNARINRQNSIHASRTIDQVKCELKAGTAGGGQGRVQNLRSSFSQQI